MADDRKRLALYEDVEAALLEGGSNTTMTEATGLLAVNLAEAMDIQDRRNSDPVVQETLFRHSIRTFPESPVAARSLGHKLEQGGRELEAMKLYREGVARSSTERLDLRLLLASCCSPFRQGDMRCRARHNLSIRGWVNVGSAAVRILCDDSVPPSYALLRELHPSEFDSLLWCTDIFLRVSGEIRRLMHHIKTSDTPLRNVPSPGRDLVNIPSFSWQYLGHNMRPLMEGLCWILVAMTAGLQATTGLHPQNGWDKKSEAVVVAGGMDQDREQISATCKKSGRDERIVVGVVMERRGNHSPHRLVQGVLESMDRSKFRLVAFSRDYFSGLPRRGTGCATSCTGSGGVRMAPLRDGSGRSVC